MQLKGNVDVARAIKSNDVHETFAQYFYIFEGAVIPLSGASRPTGVESEYRGQVTYL